MESTSPYQFRVLSVIRSHGGWKYYGCDAEALLRSSWLYSNGATCAGWICGTPWQPTRVDPFTHITQSRLGEISAVDAAG